MDASGDAWQQPDLPGAVPFFMGAPNQVSPDGAQSFNHRPFTTGRQARQSF
jgi:hypothetical protein